MTKRIVKRIAKIAGGIAAMLAIVLFVHIYMVTRPKAADAHAHTMARIDLKQQINQADANKITAWLYQQKGIDHVLCNPATAIVVFTFFPAQTTANEVVANFKNNLSYKAERYMPGPEDMQSGCPVMTGGLSSKVYAFFKNI